MEDSKTLLLLRNPEQEPSDKLFKSIIDRSLYDVLKKMEQNIAAAGLALEWRYYKDGKAWLGKVTYKKKTIVWLSVLKEFIKAGFYFTEKTRLGVLDLDVNAIIKSSFAETKPVGKLIPLAAEIKAEENLKDFIILLDYKKNLR